jgi:hypothetical protein
MIKTLNTQDMQVRIEELEEEFAEWLSRLDDEQRLNIADNLDLTIAKMQDGDWREAWEGTPEGEELKNILALKEDIGREWSDGVYLVADRDFEEFAEQEAEELSLIKDSNAWPANCIDWSKAADELKSDYSQVDYDSETYWYRS